MADRRGLMIALAFAVAGCSPAAPASPVFTGIGPDQFAVVLPANADPATIEAAARAKCAGKSWCRVLGWADAAAAASAMPMTDKEAAALAFSYSLNRASGLEEALWDCQRFAHADTARCLAK